jgi:hypothetical protein
MPDSAPITGPDNTLAANALLAIGKVKQIHKCPTCGARINTNKCIGCFIEERKRKLK